MVRENNAIMGKKSHFSICKEDFKQLLLINQDEIACFFISLYYMSIAKEKISKLYYSIGEVSKMFEVNASLIRFWEKEFSLIKPRKNKKGNRLFTEKDIENIREVYDLVKVKGYTLDGAKSFMKSTPRKEDPVKVDHPMVVERLEGIKSELNQLLAKL